MKYLFLDTSANRIVVAILEDEKILFYFEDSNDTKLSERIMPIINDAFLKSNLKPIDINTIFVVNGPGSFTGIRVGVTIAKTIAWALKIKVVPISELELMATTTFTGDYIVPLIDARRDYVYAGMYDNTLTNIMKDSHILITDLMNKLPSDKNIVFTSYDNFNFETIKTKYDIIKVINKHVNDEGINPHKLNPNYLKLTEAEEKLINDKRD